MKYCLLVSLLLVGLIAHSQQNDTHGEIAGNVIDQAGNAVSGATVEAVPQALGFDGITPRSVKTDKYGRFEFRGGFAFGAYRLYSYKLADSYPDPSDKFYADTLHEAPTVKLATDKPTAVITLTLGQKAGVVVGKVNDAQTGAPLKATLVFMDADGNHHSVLTDGEYRALLPAGKDLTMMVEVMSPDYPPQSRTDPIRLEPGQEMKLDIRLSKQ